MATEAIPSQDSQTPETSIGTLMVDLSIVRPQDGEGDSENDDALKLGRVAWRDQEAPPPRQKAGNPPLIDSRTAIFSVGLISAVAIVIAYRDTIATALGL